MREIHDTAEATVGTEPRVVFEMITRLEHLPIWNSAVEEVIEQPHRLTPGATWTVQMHPAKLMRWKSVSTLQELDADACRFAYRSVNADGNPSYSLWRWEVSSQGEAAKVSVRWDVYLETLDRRLLAGPIRRRQLRREVSASLEAVANLAARPAS
jgi:Polyketide cyclase / dehydrase and lipid transport